MKAAGPELYEAVVDLAEGALRREIPAADLHSLEDTFLIYTYNHHMNDIAFNAGIL